MTNETKQEKGAKRIVVTISRIIADISELLFVFAGFIGIASTAGVVAYIVDEWATIPPKNCLLIILACVIWMVITVTWQKKHFGNWHEEIRTECKVILVISFAVSAGFYIMLTRMMLYDDQAFFRNSWHMDNCKIFLWMMAVTAVFSLLFVFLSSEKED